MTRAAGGVRSRYGPTLLGLPFVEIATGGRAGPAVARGWIAIGDVAFGVLLSVGGVAFGGFALGGVGVGALTIGGVAVGALALGGVGIGYLAVGGAALGWKAALGGAAVARELALGGAAVARHANDAAAEAFFRTAPFRYGRAAVDHAYLFLLLALLPMFFRRRDEGRSATTTEEGVEPPPPIEPGD